MPHRRPALGPGAPNSPGLSGKDDLDDLETILAGLTSLQNESKEGTNGRLSLYIERLRRVIDQRKKQVPGPATAIMKPGASAQVRDVNVVRGSVETGSVVGGGSVTIENAAKRDVNKSNLAIHHITNATIVNLGSEPAGKAEASETISEVERDYLLRLRDTASRIPLGKLDLQMSLPSHETPDIRLNDIYVPLDITRTQRALNKDNQPPAWVPVPLLDAVIRNRQLVILGDPGSGKTSFLNFLTLCLAGARLYPDKGYLEHLNVPQKDRRRAANWRHGPLLPVRIDLREFVHDLPERVNRGTAALVSKHIASRLKDHNLGEFASEIEKALRQGKALVMFDGLDEIADEKHRHIVRDAVMDFADSYQRSRFLVTCRVLSYTNPQWQLSSFPAVTLAPLSQDSIHLFIDKWYYSLAHRHYMSLEAAKAKARELRDAATCLHDLAQNPMLLTVMAVVHTYKGTLPRERARLYDDTVRLLLWEWQRSKQISPNEWQKGILEELNTREERLINGLCEVAFRVHSAQEGKGPTVNIPEGDVLRVLKNYLDGDWGKAQKFCDYVEKRAGLLIGKGRNRNGEAMFAFPHRGFQEFLAARHIVSDRNFERRVAVLATKGDIWREVLLLAVGHLVYNQQDVFRPLNAINLLCRAEPPEDAAGWRILWWAGEMLAIVGRSVAEQDELIGKQMVPRLISHLVKLVEGGHLTAVERAQAADALGWLGDPRPGVCSLEPDMVRIEGGPFEMGDDDVRHKITLKPFWIARYPVTNAQFSLFLNDRDGYDQAEHWTEAGLAWRERAAQRGGYIHDARRGTPNRPVAGITWYEAVAYANWLRRKTGKPYRLPTEAEWERTAAGLERRRYPFGNRASDDTANIRETGIGETTPVGTFRLDRTPEGVFDMGGNVWEWCASLDSEYPYRADDGREKLDARGPRILRGGSYDSTRSQIHCTQRRPAEPHARVPLIGFRLVRD